jgi:hypothetical protein
MPFSSTRTRFGPTRAGREARAGYTWLVSERIREIRAAALQNLGAIDAVDDRREKGSILCDRRCRNDDGVELLFGVGAAVCQKNGGMGERRERERRDENGFDVHGP